MDSDRELLEWAAKAAKLILGEFKGRIVRYESDGQPVYWNPLHDDGDALRLAVDLDLAIVPYPIYNKQKHSVLVQKKNLDEPRFEKMELHGDDPRAATRRAIVSAAAELERQHAEIERLTTENEALKAAVSEAVAEEREACEERVVSLFEVLETPYLPDITRAIHASDKA